MGPSIGRRLESAAAAVCWAYAAALLAFFALRSTLRPWPPPLALVSTFAPFLFLPLLLVVPLALWARSRWALIPTVAVLLLFAGRYGPLFVPRPGPGRCAANPGLRVMTFNLGWNLARGEELVAIIEAEEPDILAVQEVTPAMAALFEQELAAAYPYTVLRPGVETTGLLSRYPILAEEWIEPSGGGRATLHVTVGWNGLPLEIFVVHPWAPGLDWVRDTLIPQGLHDTVPQRQITEVAALAAAADGLTVLLGDFNSTDDTQAYAETAALLVDSYRQGGWGFGFTFPKGLRVRGLPVPGPLVRIDYIFHSDRFCTQWARVDCGGGSDHCYVTAQLAEASP
jgi:vancomycin resistance protein VanJ